MSGKWQLETMSTLVINRIARQLTRLVDQRLKPLGLTASQLPVLVALKHGEKRPQKDLVLAAGVERSSMAQLLAHMDRDGLIRREPSPNDRRSSLITLTDHALSLLEPGRDALRRIDEDACAGLPGTDRTARRPSIFAAPRRGGGHPGRMQAVLRESCEALFAMNGMRNPTPRAQMRDGFNQGGIAFEGGEQGALKGPPHGRRTA